ncbi:glycosyltransferase family 2 protein [Rheinheimera sp. D18]|uniref:glycosyltransferase family 2 protein n=1 Tax=Rheinheimera sp. D18 TaxID=2545632 RepID=UPI00104403EE|nr:glycosyltransferase family 2 protein [Rheinheimera sp. D18]QBL10695.1 glycosyltransferase family 2 protein [Rheinheimera sp. D18]
MHNCFVIPIYNHHDTIAHTVQQLLPFGYSVIIADDGSDAATKQVLAELASQHQQVEVITLQQNSGKGVAMCTAMQHAYQRGFSHALQIDADGQHDITDIPLFWQKSAQYPQALISGAPVYDSSMPIGRKIGREITHFWVRIETLSLQIKDSMLGFRVYPLQSCVDIMQRYAIGQRMDFDTDIMVRLFWHDVPVYFIATKVIYPPGGRSNFKMLRDNWLISKMHTRLFFGMLWRVPHLLTRRQRVKHEG